MTHAPSMTLAEAVRTAQAAAQQHHSAHADAVTESGYGMHLSVTAAINEHGEPAVKAVVKEMQLFNKGFGPSSMPTPSATGSLGDPTLQDVPQEKFTADGEFDRMKRLVAGGDRQPRQSAGERHTMGTSPCSSSSHWAPRTDAPSPAPTCLARTWRRHDQAGAHEVGQVPGGNPGEHRPHPQATQQARRDVCGGAEQGLVSHQVGLLVQGAARVLGR
jgi:hypothetical protein